MSVSGSCCDSTGISVSDSISVSVVSLCSGSDATIELEESVFLLDFMNSAIPPRINIEEGYTFNGWKSQYGMWDSIDVSKINEPLTFTAIISKQNYKVNFEGCGNTIINVPHGTIISKANNTTFNNINCDKEGHIFNGWKEEFTNNIKSLNILCIILYVVICYIIFYFIKVLYTQLQIRVGKSGYANA